MEKKRRMNLEITGDDLESTQFKNCITPGADKVSGQRLQIVHSQFESAVIGLFSEMPLEQSAMAQAIFKNSSSIQPIQGTVTVLKTFRYQDTVYYIYRHNGVIDIYIDDKYICDNGFANRKHTDLSKLEIGVEYDLDGTDFMKSYIDAYKPATDTVGYGSNVRCILSTNLDNVQDSVSVSERFLDKFVAIKPNCINVHLNNNKKLISNYPNIFPPLGKKFVDNPLVLKIVKGDDTSASSIALDASSPTGFEDDVIMLEPLTYINKIEVFCNEDIADPILNRYRLDLLEFREEMYSYMLTFVDEPLSEEFVIIRNNYGCVKFRDRKIDLKYPLIKIYTKTISRSETESKFTTLNGGKITVANVYSNDKFTDEFGETIDVIYPASSLIGRTISGTLYEVHLNSIGIFINRAVENDTITPERLHEALTKIYNILGKKDEWEYANMSPEDLMEYLKHNKMNWQIMPYEKNLIVSCISEVTSVAEEYFGWKPLKIFNKGKEVTEPHVVGYLFMMRLRHDRYHAVSGSSIPRKDSRGHLIDKSTEKKDGRSIFSTKPTKMSIFAIHKILANLSNESAHILFKEKYQLHSTHELLNSVGFKLSTTKVIKNRKEVLEDDDD